MTGIHDRFPPARAGAASVEALEPRVLLSGFTAYNDTVAGPLTHANATRYTDNGGTASGQLKDIATGAYTPVLLSTVAVGVSFGGTGTNPAAGTPAGTIFGGYVDFTSTAGANSLEMSGSASYTYQFENLNAGCTYEFVGTAVRGSSSYTDRWTLVTLLGAESFTAAHSTGVGIVTSGLAPNQAALWSGANHLSTQGFVVQWTHIVPGVDGEFEVVSQQYTGPIPTSVDPAGVADGSKGYGLNGIRLIERAPSAPPTVVNTPATNIEAFAAEIGGQVTDTGGEAPTVLLYWGASDGGIVPGAWDHVVNLDTRTGAFSELLGGLSQATPYYYRSWAQNSVGARWASSTASFTTLTAAAPAVVNLPASNVGAYSAWLHGQVTHTGNDPPLVTVYYGPTNGGTSPGAWARSVSAGVQSGVFVATVDDLDPETTYYFAAYAQNAVGGAWATPALSFATTAPLPLQITEFMADNKATLLTRTRTSTSVPFAGDYTSPDWIEIHNPTDAVAVLGGFHLTDNLDDPKQWAFPAGTTIAPRGYLVVFASGLNITNPALDENGCLHTNFKMRDEGGEDVALTNADGTVVFAYEDYPPQNEDMSYGIGGDGLVRFYPAPTPGWDNTNDVPRAPRFSLPSTMFTTSIVVNLTAGYPTDVIRYTLDETLPTTSSPIWTGPMTLTTTTMLRAVAIGANGKSSEVVGASYVLLGADVLTRSSNLPVVVVETFGDAVPSPTGGFGDCYIALFEPGADGRTWLTNPMVLGTRGGLHIRGSSSAGFAKKQYRVEFWDERNEDRRLEWLGLPAEADWIFYGPSQYDRALINNPLMYDLSNQVGRYAVRTRWVEMYLNANGGAVTASDYVGIYAVMEVIERGDDRVDVEALSTGAGGVPVSGGFIWRKDRGSAYVEPEVPTAAQKTYIDGYINSFQAAATGPNFKDPVLGYAAWADVASFVDHNLLNMLAMNVDAMRLSGYYFKTAAGKLEAGPIWDFDRALESTDGRDDNPLWWNGTGDSTLYFNDTSRVMLWWPQMFQDPDFVQKYIDRWFELRAGAFSLSNLYATIDAHAAQLQEAAPRDYARWYAARFGGFAGEIQHMKDWLTSRVNWVDSQWIARPTFNVTGPVVAPGTPVTLSAPAGSIFYTLNGTDPRASGGGIRPGAILATGPITITAAYTPITARVYRPGYLPSSGAPGYVASGDDWSAPVTMEYFIHPLAASGDLVIAEINYHPHDPTPAELASQPPGATPYVGNDFEFIEFLNVGGRTINVSGVHFTDGITFRFASHVLAPGQRIVIVENLAGFTARYGINGSLAGTGITVAGAWTGELNNAGERATVASRSGAALLDFTFSDSGDWPGRADGKGSALELIDPWAVPTAEPDRTNYLQDGDNWRSSTRYGGSPGHADDAPIPIVINEVLTHTDDPLADAIELHNTSTTDSIDLGGWWLSDSWGWDWNPQNGDYKKFRIPAGTVLGPGEYRVFWQGHFVGGVMLFADDEFGGGAKGFALNSAKGDDVWLLKADAAGNLTHFVDHAEFGAAANGESFGRWPDGAGNLYPMLSRTLPGPNSGPRVGPLVISEVHYQPTPSNDLEFLEIFNPTASPVNLWEHYFVAGQWRDYPWKVEGHLFAVGTTLAPGEALLVVPFNPSNTTLLNAFKSHYGLGGSSVRIVGPYDGYLDNSGETVRLYRPDEPPPEDPSVTPYLLVDEVTYGNAAPWPTTPAGGGSSLNRWAADAWGDAPSSWFPAAPTPGTARPFPPRVTAVALNPRDGAPDRTLSDVDPSGLGVHTVRVAFNKAVTFAADDVTVQKVTFDALGQEVVLGDVTPATVVGSGTAEMLITFADPWNTMVDTWVKVTLRAGGILDAQGVALDGEPWTDSTGLGYLAATPLDLPTGNGTPGGDAVFYVGSLRGDFSADRQLTLDDLDLFLAQHAAGYRDADFRGVGFGVRPPDGLVRPGDVAGFLAAYQAGVAADRRLEPLPGTGGGGAAPAAAEPPDSAAPGPLASAAPLAAEPIRAAALPAPAAVSPASDPPAADPPALAQAVAAPTLALGGLPGAIAALTLTQAAPMAANEAEAGADPLGLAASADAASPADGPDEAVPSPAEAHSAPPVATNPHAPAPFLDGDLIDLLALPDLAVLTF